MKRLFLLSTFLMGLYVLSGCVINQGSPEATQTSDTISTEDVGESEDILTTEMQISNEDAYWKITQYGSDDGSQYMFYTVESNNGDLVIIDGGYTSHKDFVKSVIQGYDNHVTAWIITHPHPDHVGAFNEIISGNSITVDTIYTIPVNQKRYEETAAGYDDYPTCEKFLSLVRDMDNVVYLQEGDELNLIGLKMKVFHSWDEQVDTLSSDLCNNGSMVFKLYAEQESMLFCSDVESPMEGKLVSKYGNELRSDYVQCAHHGNWGLSIGFYELVSPRIAFMDAPPFVIDPEDSIFDGYLLKKHFIENNIQIYRFTTAPNSIILK